MGNTICCTQICCDGANLCGSWKGTDKELDSDTLLLTDTDDDEKSEDFHSVCSRSTGSPRRRNQSHGSSIFNSSDVWYDALMEHEWLNEETFDVTDEELKILKDHITKKFPGTDSNYLSDAYIRSVASKPYSKNMSIRRPLEVSSVFLLDLIWFGLVGCFDLIFDLVGWSALQQQQLALFVLFCVL